VVDRPKEPPKLDDEDELGDAFPSERPTARAEPPSDRPTVSPPFDLEEFAKHSDSKLRAVRSPVPQVPDLSTAPPPLADLDLAQDFPAVERPRAPQITISNESEMEEARIRSVLMPSDPPPGKAPSAAPRPPPRAYDDIQDEPLEEAAPQTRAYPSEYEKDPFAHLSSQTPASSPALPPEQNKLTDMSDRFSLGDYTGALELAEAILAEDPASAQAIRCADECRAKLIQMYTARIGPLDRVPMVLVAREQLRWLSIDHRAGFLLSHVDGVSNLEMILDVSGMPLLDALKILAELQQQRVISFR
jgi:hypothetical protein